HHAIANTPAMLDSRTQLHGRIHRIVQPSRPAGMRSVTAGIVFAVLCALALSQPVPEPDNEQAANTAAVPPAAQQPTRTATPFDGTIPAGLVRAVTGGGAIYSDAPADFPDFVLPDGITLMGSQDSVGQQRLLYRTSLSGAEAQRAFVAALEAEGWQSLAAPNSAPRNGFVVPASLQAA